MLIELFAGDAGLYHAVEIIGMHGNDSVHVAKSDANAADGCVHMPFQRSARAEGNDRDAPLGADPQLTTHRSYGVPRPEPTPELMQMVQAVRINPTGELPAPLPIPAAAEALSVLDGFTPTPTDTRDRETKFTQLKGQFLIDRDGVVRWSEIECGKEGFAGFGKFPTHAELIEAARRAL